MNKNLLMKQNNELFSRIQLLKKQNIALTAQVQELNSNAINFAKEIEALKAEISELKKIATPVDMAPVEADAEKKETVSQIEETKNALDEIVLPDDFTYASDVIGNIVIKAAGFINQLTASDNSNKKELVNLILGRTEISKSEILSIVSSEVSFDSKKELINTQYEEALEYFKSIMEQ